MISKRKSTFLFMYKNPKIKSLEKLVSNLTEIKHGDFKKDHGRILELLSEEVGFGAITTLAQYYDPLLCCFTFSNFQLDPTLEEFERILGRELEHHDPFPKLNEDVTPKRIPLDLSIDVHEVLENWDVNGGLQRVYQEIPGRFSPKVKEGGELESILRSSGSLNLYNCTLFEHRQLCGSYIRVSLSFRKSCAFSLG